MNINNRNSLLFVFVFRTLRLRRCPFDTFQPKQKRGLNFDREDIRIPFTERTGNDRENPRRHRRELRERHELFHEPATIFRECQYNWTRQLPRPDGKVLSESCEIATVVCKVKTASDEEQPEMEQKRLASEDTHERIARNQSNRTVGAKSCRSKTILRCCRSILMARIT